MSEPIVSAESQRLRRCKTPRENAGSVNSAKIHQSKQKRQSGGVDSFIVAFLLLISNHLMLWCLLIGGAVLLPHVLKMRDAVQLLQYQRSVAPVAPILRQD